MLTLSTTPNAGNLLRQAVLLLTARHPRLQDAYDLAMLAGVDALSVEVLVRIAEVLAGKGEYGKAEELLSGIDVERVYAKNFNLKDINARIGWVLYWDKREYDKVLQWIGKDIQHYDVLHPNSSIKTQHTYKQALDADYRIRTSEICTNPIRLSPAWQINYAKAVAITKGISQALPLIDKAYTSSPMLKNGYSSISWFFYEKNGAAYDKTIPYFEKDFHSNRLNGGWNLHYAHALAFVDRMHEAETIVQKVYDSDKTVSNGFALCGWMRFIVTEYSPAEALGWFERDADLGRLSGIIHYHTKILGALAKHDLAAETIAKSYAENPSAHSAYSLFGWHCHAVGNNSPEAALNFFEKDLKVNRFQPFYAGNQYAGLWACLRDRCAAERLVDEYYSDVRRINNGNLFVGLCDYAFTGDPDYLMHMAEKDEHIGRLNSSQNNFIYAAILMFHGNIDKSSAFLKIAASQSHYAYKRGKAFLLGNIPSGQKLIEQFFTPTLITMFDELCMKSDVASAISATTAITDGHA